MLERTILIKNKTGLHLRPASELSALALNYRCKSLMIIGDKSFNLKSVLSVLSAQVAALSEITIRCEGVDEAEAIEALTGYLSPGSN